MNIGDLLDRATITLIKKHKKADKHIPTYKFYKLIEELCNMNIKLWDLEDDIRKDIAIGDAGILGKKIARTNDRRCEIKNELNELLGINKKEEKIYKSNN